MILHSSYEYLFHAKSNVFSVSSSFHNYVQNQFHTSIQLFQCDNGRKLNNQPLLHFFKENVLKFTFHVRTGLGKMAKSNVPFTPSITLFEPFCFKPHFLLNFGLNISSHRFIPSIFFSPPLSLSKPRLSSFLDLFAIMITYVSLVVYVIQISHLLLCINYLHFLPLTFILDLILIILVIDALILSPNVSSSLII